jgi:uncharacterized protein (DUF1330 family)
MLQGHRADCAGPFAPADHAGEAHHRANIVAPSREGADFRATVKIFSLHPDHGRLLARRAQWRFQKALRTVYAPALAKMENRMPKGYWIARVTVNNAEMYPDYIRATVPALQKYGGRFLARGGRHEAMEGEARARNVIIEFDSFEQAAACYHSPEYQAAAAIRQRCADGEIVVVEGAE